jgi:hypothetical protein
MARKGSAAKKSNNHKRQVELRGEVRAADLDGHQFSLRLDDGTKVRARFTAAQEQSVTEALRDHASRRLRLKGSGEVVLDGEIRVASVKSLVVEPLEVGRPVSSAKPIWEVALEIAANVHEEDWTKVPSDGARNLHHYLQGAPKESEP